MFQNPKCFECRCGAVDGEFPPAYDVASKHRSTENTAQKDPSAYLYKVYTKYRQILWFGGLGPIPKSSHKYMQIL